MTPARAAAWPLALLFLVGAINLFDRQIINILAEDIKTELDISDASLGLLTGTAFGIFYALLGVPLGWLCDRLDRVRLLAAAVAAWSAFTGLCGMATGFWQLFAARLGVGVGEAVSQPASTALIADLFPRGGRTLAMSILFMGAPIGSFAGLLVGGWAGSQWGWRTAFLVAAIPGFVIAAVMLLTMREPRPDGGPAARRIALLPLIRTLLARPGYRWLTLALTCSTFLLYATSAWLPAFFIRVHGLGVAEIALWSALAVGVGGAAGSFGAGLLCALLRRRTESPESLVLILALAMLLPCLLMTVFLAQTGLALAAMVALNLLVFAYPGPIAVLLQREGAPETLALTVAVANSISNVVSLAIGLPLVGLLSDRLADAAGARAIGQALAAAGLLAVMLGIAAHMLARRARRRDREPAQ